MSPEQSVICANIYTISRCTAGCHLRIPPTQTKSWRSRGISYSPLDRPCQLRRSQSTASHALRSMICVSRWRGSSRAGTSTARCSCRSGSGRHRALYPCSGGRLYGCTGSRSSVCCWCLSVVEAFRDDLDLAGYCCCLQSDDEM